MDFDSALASLQEMFPDHPLEDLSFVLLNASGDVQQASENILAKTAVDPTKPKARPQVLNQFIDLFPRETPQLNSLNSNCLSLVPQVTPSVNHCGQICQATKGHKRLYRMWWPTPHFPAYNPIPTNDLQLQREQSSWATSNPDSSGSSISGTPGLTPHRHANRPEAESIAYLPDHLKQAIFSSAEIETHVGEQSSSKSHFGQDQACTAQNQIVDGFSHLNLTPQFNSPEPSWEAHADSPEATPFRQSAPLFPDHAPSHAQAELQRLKDSFPTLSDEMVANSLVTSGYATDQATTCCLNLLMMRDGVPEWDSASDPDGSSVTTDGAAEFESPMHANKSALQYRPLDDSEMLQASLAVLLHCGCCLILSLPDAVHAVYMWCHALHLSRLYCADDVPASICHMLLVAQLPNWSGA